MFPTVVLFTVVFILQNVIVSHALDEELKSEPVEPDLRSENTNANNVNEVQDKSAKQFPKGIVPYFVDPESYDSLITSRIHEAMDIVEASSCVVFNQMDYKPTEPSYSWVHFTNPAEERECNHESVFGDNGEIIVVIGFDCLSSSNLLHTVLHALGFKDEVSHPHRDQYVRILWENIQPRYRNLFRMQYEGAPYKVVEYDPMSVMHFHDRAFSMNGGPTIAPRVPGLLIAPSEKLSQLDIMKLRLWYGHECNKRKVSALLEKCKTVLHNSPTALFGEKQDTSESVEDDGSNLYAGNALNPNKLNGIGYDDDDDYYYESDYNDYYSDY